MSTRRAVVPLLLVAALILLAGCTVEIPEGEVGVPFDQMTGELGEPLQPGTHFVGAFTAVTTYPTTPQVLTLYPQDLSTSEYVSEISGRTSDGEEVGAQLEVTFRLNPDQISQIHRRWEHYYVNSLIRVLARQIYREEIGNFLVRDLYIDPAVREELRSSVETRLGEVLAEEGFLLDQIRLIDLSISLMATQPIDNALAESGITLIRIGYMGIVADNATGEIAEVLNEGAYTLDLENRTLTLYDLGPGHISFSDSYGDFDLIQVQTADGETVSIDGSFTYEIEPTRIVDIYQQWQDRYEAGFLAPLIQEVTTQVVSTLVSDEIYEDESPYSEISTMISAALAPQMLEEGFILHRISIFNVEFPITFAEQAETATAVYVTQAAAQGNVIVQEDEVGLLVDTATDEPRELLIPGVYTIDPTTETVVIYSLSQRALTLSGDDPDDEYGMVVASTVDREEIRIDLTIIFSINAYQVGLLYERGHGNESFEFLIPMIREICREVVGEYEVDQILEQSEEIRERITNTLRVRMFDEGYSLTDFLLRDIQFSPEFAATLEAQQIQEQQEYYATMTATYQATP